jgi:hypothetical protein
MCAGCVMAATAGASGARAWLQAQHLTWLTPRRMRAATLGLVTAAVVVSSVGVKGSTAPSHASSATPAAQVSAAHPAAGARAAPASPAAPAAR